MKKNQEHSLKNRIVDDLDLPKDLYLGMPIQTITGHSEILIENYRGILVYTKELVLIQTKICRIRIEGQKLVIQYYTNDEMKVKGYIKQIIYE